MSSVPENLLARVSPGPHENKDEGAIRLIGLSGLSS